MSEDKKIEQLIAHNVKKITISKNVYEKYKTKISYSGLEQIWYGYRWKEVL